MLDLTDAERAWLRRSGEEHCLLAELTFLGDNGLPGEFNDGQERQVYVSNMPYVTGTTGTLPNQIFRSCITKTPDLVRRLSDSLVGRGTTSYGDLLVDNRNLVRTDWLFRNWDGRRVRLWLGHPSWDFDSFIPILADGRIVDVFDAGGYQIGFKLSDKSALLNKPVMPDGVVLAGDPTDATDTPIPRGGEPTPLSLGYLNENVPCEAIDDVDHEYLWTYADADNPPWTANGTIENPVDVRESGVSLKTTSVVDSFDAGSDLVHWVEHGLPVGARVCFIGTAGDEEPPDPLVPSHSGDVRTYYWVSDSSHGPDSFRLASSLAAAEAGSFIDITTSQPNAVRIEAYIWTNNAPGRFTLAARPAEGGDITADVYGLGLDAEPSSTRVITGADIVEFVATSTLVRQSVLTMADIDTDSLAAFEVSCPQPMSIYIDTMTFAELLDQVCISVGASWSFNRNGLLQFTVLDAFSTGEGDFAYEFGIGDAKIRSFRMVRRILPKVNVKVSGRKNNHQQTTLAASLSNFKRDQYGREYVVKTGILAPAVWYEDPTNHLNATREPVIETLLALDVDIQAEATRLAQLYSVVNSVWQIDSHQAIYALDPGDLVNMTFPKHTSRGMVIATGDIVKGTSWVQILAEMPGTTPIISDPPTEEETDDGVRTRSVAFSGSGSVVWVNGGEVLVDEFSDISVFEIALNTPGVTNHAAQSFTGGAYYLKRARLGLGKHNSPSGPITAKLYAHSGTYGTTGIPTGPALAVSTNSVDASTLSVHPAATWVDFTFDGTYLMSAGTKYCIAVEWACSNTSIWVGVYGNLGASGNPSSNFGSGWGATNFFDLGYAIYGTAP